MGAWSVNWNIRRVDTMGASYEDLVAAQQMFDGKVGEARSGAPVIRVALVDDVTGKELAVWTPESDRPVPPKYETSVCPSQLSLLILTLVALGIGVSIWDAHRNRGGK